MMVFKAAEDVCATPPTVGQGVNIVQTVGNTGRNVTKVNCSFLPTITALLIKILAVTKQLYTLLCLSVCLSVFSCDNIQKN